MTDKATRSRKIIRHRCHEKPVAKKKEITTGNVNTFFGIYERRCPNYPILENRIVK